MVVYEKEHQIINLHGIDFTIGFLHRLIYDSYVTNFRFSDIRKRCVDDVIPVMQDFSNNRNISKIYLYRN